MLSSLTVPAGGKASNLPPLPQRMRVEAASGLAGAGQTRDMARVNMAKSASRLRVARSEALDRTSKLPTRA